MPIKECCLMLTCAKLTIILILLHKIHGDCTIKPFCGSKFYLLSYCPLFGIYNGDIVNEPMECLLCSYNACSNTVNDL